MYLERESQLRLWDFIIRELITSGHSFVLVYELLEFGHSKSQVYEAVLIHRFATANAHSKLGISLCISNSLESVRFIDPLLGLRYDSRKWATNLASLVSSDDISPFLPTGYLLLVLMNPASDYAF
jgi:hypothetical protein